MNMQRIGDFYATFYLNEINEQKSIEAKIRLALAILAFIISTSFFLIERILQSIVNSATTLDTLSLFAITFSVVIFGYLCYCVYRGLVGWKYHEIPLPKLGEYYVRLKRYSAKCRSKHGKDEMELRIMTAFEEKVVECFVECAERNQVINQRRLSYVAKYYVALPFFLLALASLYFLFYFR